MTIRPARAGPFLLERRIGRGGAGTVWRARHEVSGASVAVKLASEGVDDPAAVELETATMAMLRHPHIVEVYDRGVLDEATMDHPVGTRWLALELAAGSSTQHAPQLSWDELAQLVRDVLAALAYAHARGVLHRDVKPGNVLRFPGPTTRWKLADFGIAQVQSLETQHLGASPSYAPPEQTGQRMDQGPWTDLYALALTVWHLCTKQRVPWRWHDDGSIWHELPAFTPRFEVPTGLEAWLRWLTSRDPGQRPARAADARQGFDELVADRPILRRPPSLPAAPSTDARARPGLLHGVGLQLFGRRALPVVGHDAVRRTLWGALRQAEAGGTSRVVALDGPPGVGRRKLVRWLARSAHAHGAHGVVLDPLRPDRAVRQLLGSTDPSVVERFADRHGLHPVDRHGLLALAQRGSTADPASLVAALDAAAEERPIVVADPVGQGWPSLVVKAIAERLHDRPILAATVDPDAGGEVLPVGAMERDEMERVLDHTLPLESALRSYLREHAHGIPGRPIAWLRRWASNGELRLGRHGIERAGGLPERLPPLATDLQQMRVRDLLAAVPVEEWRWVALLAVLGPTIERSWLAPLRRAHGPVVHELVVRGHLLPSRRTWRFADPSFHDALLAGVDELPQAHAAAAGLLEEARGPLHLIGLHLHRAGRHAEAIDPLLAGSEALWLQGDPRFELVDAAHEAMRAAADDEDPRWVVLHRHHGQVLRQLGRADQAIEPLRRSVRLARAQGGGAPLARSLAALATTRIMTDDDDDLDPLFAEASEAAGDDVAALASVTLSWSEYLVFTGSHARVLRELPPHLPHLEDHARSAAHVVLGRAASHTGDIDAARHHALNARVRGLEIHARGGVIMACFLLGEVHLQAREDAAALASFEEALGLARFTTSTDLAIADLNLAFSLCRLGRYDEALTTATEGSTLARRFGWRAMELVARAVALWPLAALGIGEAFDEQLLACRPLIEERLSSWEVAEALVEAYALLPDDASPRKSRVLRLAEAMAGRLPEGPLRDRIAALSVP